MDTEKEKKGRITFDYEHSHNSYFGFRSGDRLTYEEFQKFLSNFRKPRRLHETHVFQWSAPVMGTRQEGNETIKTVSFLKFRWETPEEVQRDNIIQEEMARSHSTISDPWRMVPDSWLADLD